MQRRSRLQPIVLSTEEYGQLVTWSRNPPRVGRSLALRARIILHCRHGRSNCQVARRLGVPQQTVCKWRQRFIAQRLHGLLDQPRSISDSLVEAVLAKTLHEPPPGTERWSSRRLASEIGISQRAVLRIWRAFEL